MKWLLLLLAFSFPRCMYAADPPCIPGVDHYELHVGDLSVAQKDPLVERYDPYIVTDVNNNCAAVWFCDVGHRWERWALYGHGNDLDNCAYPTAKAMLLMLITKEQKLEWWNDAIETDPVKSAATLAKDAPALALVMSVPYPSTIPPSGLVTQATTAYKLTVTGNGPRRFDPVGTVPLGTPCDPTQKMDNYYRIDRNLVKYPKGVIMSPDAWAQCTP